MFLVLGAGVRAEGQERGTGISASNLNGTTQQDATGNTSAQSGAHNYVLLNPQAGNFPQQPGEIKLTRMPANLGLRGLADSAQYKNMLRGMVTSQVPVMFQTMMMVENGAATGYIGALQSVSNLLGNSVQAADLELKMRHIADSSGAAERAYVNAVYDGLKAQSANQGQSLWPVGLFYASGDRLDDAGLTPKHKIESEFKRHKDGGASVSDNLPESKRSSNSGAQIDLVETVFKGTEGDSVADKYKTIVQKIVGGVTAQTEGADRSSPALMIKTVYVKPSLEATVDKSDYNPLDGPPLPDKVFGINVERENKRKETWKAMYELLGFYCVFKRDNGNLGQEMFTQKKFASQRLDTAGAEAMNKISSKNLKISLNLLDQIFKIWVQTTIDSTQPTKINCDFSNAEAEMPEDGSVNNSGDSCETAEKAKRCRRNKWLYRLVDILALDKLIDESRAAYEYTMQQALSADVSTAQMLNTLFCSSFMSKSSSDNGNQQCNLAFYFDSINGMNRQRWNDQLEATAKLAQSLGGSSNFRFQPNNSLAAASGSTDAAGDADPGGGSGGGGSGSGSGSGLGGGGE
jgi:hypothetical protein